MDTRLIQSTQMTYNAGENVIPAREMHSIGIHRGAPIQLRQERDGQYIERIFLDGDLVLIPAGMPNYCAHTVAASGLYLDISPDLLMDTALQIDVNPDEIELPTIFGTPDPILYQVAQLFHQENEAPGLGGQLYLDNLSQQIALHLLRQYTSQNFSPAASQFTEQDARQRIQGSLDLIHDQLNADLSLDVLADAAHLTSYHFSRVFKQAIGQTPHQYVIEQRVKQAGELLKTPTLSIAEVAARVGFSDQSHLTRHMKRLIGLTPRQYQQKNAR